MSNFSDLNVLLIDDAKGMRHILVYALNRLGIKQVEVTASEERAYRFYSYNAPDIIIYNHDIELTNGINFTRKIRKERRYDSPVPVVMISGHSSEFLIKAAIGAGVNEFLLKPFRIKDLMLRVKHAVESPLSVIEVQGYFGPDRRRSSVSKKYTGVLKRKTDQSKESWFVGFRNENTMGVEKTNQL